MSMDFFFFLLFFCSLRSSSLVSFYFSFLSFLLTPPRLGSPFWFSGVFGPFGLRAAAADWGLPVAVFCLFICRVYIYVFYVFYVFIFMYLYLCMSWPKIYPGTFRFTAISLPVCGRNRVSGFRRHWWALGSQFLSWCFVRRFFFFRSSYGV